MVPSTGFLRDSGIEMDNRGYIPVNDLMGTNIEGVYAAGDNRVKYLRQAVTSAGDGATAAVAAERYIDEINSFNAEVQQSDKKVLLLFFNAMVDESLAFSTLLEESNREMGNEYKIVKVDMATKKIFANKYQIQAVPAVVVLERGKEVKRLECTMDKESLKAQLLVARVYSTHISIRKVGASKFKARILGFV